MVKWCSSPKTVSLQGIIVSHFGMPRLQFKNGQLTRRGREKNWKTAKKRISCRFLTRRSRFLHLVHPWLMHTVWTATNSFPMMKFVNEPCSHLNDPLVRFAQAALPDIICEPGKNLANGCEKYKIPYFLT